MVNATSETISEVVIPDVQLTQENVDTRPVAFGEKELKDLGLGPLRDLMLFAETTQPYFCEAALEGDEHFVGQLHRSRDLTRAYAARR